ncbi:MAG: DUF4404 family protein [Chloroflexi bacterium]|nr:DUF4404 family protein [Chloroflexota bacterium]
MNNRELEELLEKLHKEIEGTKSVDEKGQELLRALSADIQELLGSTEDKKAASSMLERMETSIDHFEVTHPELTSALSSLFTILSNAGI